MDQVRRDLPDLLKGREPNLGKAVTWVSAADSRITPMTTNESLLVADIAAWPRTPRTPRSAPRSCS